MLTANAVLCMLIKAISLDNMDKVSIPFRPQPIALHLADCTASTFHIRTTSDTEGRLSSAVDHHVITTLWSRASATDYC